MTDCHDATSRMSSAQGKHPSASADSCMMSATFWGVGPTPPFTFWPTKQYRVHATSLTPCFWATPSLSARMSSRQRPNNDQHRDRLKSMLQVA